MKKIFLDIDDIFNIPGSVIYEPDKLRKINYVSINSRILRAKTLFIAIKGKRFDGHDFVNDAVRRGAEAILINKSKLNKFNHIKVPIVTVNDTTIALGDVARMWRKKLNAKIIGITGSSGKTTVKEMVAEILSEKYCVNKTEANNNNHIGVPLTILSTNEKHQVLVAEMGTNHFGEIPYTAGILSPDYSLITNIGDSHLEYLKSRTGVWKEKSVLFEHTLKQSGIVFLNYDDPMIKAKHSRTGDRISFGFSGKVDVGGKILSYTTDGRPVIEISWNDVKYKLTLPVYGEHSAKNFLAACTIALETGMSFKQISQAVKRLKNASGRLQVHEYKNFVLIDDTYNSNPDSTKAAIDLVGRIKLFKRKILILGDMLELGESSIRFHKGLKDSIEKNDIHAVYTIGHRMRSLNQSLKSSKIFNRHFANRTLLIEHIRNLDFNNSVVLVKGSRGMQMEEFVSAIQNRTME